MPSKIKHKGETMVKKEMVFETFSLEEIPEETRKWLKIVKPNDEAIIQGKYAEAILNIFNGKESALADELLAGKIIPTIVLFFQGTKNAEVLAERSAELKERFEENNIDLDTVNIIDFCGSLERIEDIEAYIKSTQNNEVLLVPFCKSVYVLIYKKDCV